MVRESIRMIVVLTIVALSAFIMLTLLTLVTGCATDGQVSVIDQESKEVIVKITSRRIGAELQKEDYRITKEVYSLCQDIVTSENLDFNRIVIENLVKVLAKETGDPLLAADIKDLLTLLDIRLGDTIQIESDQLKLVLAAARGLISGIELQKGSDGKQD